MIEFRNSGLHSMAAKLEQASRDIEREIAKAVDVEMEKLEPAVRKSAMEKLPKRGGLNVAFAARVQMKITKRHGSASLSVVALGRRDRELRLVDSGVIRHPVYGNRKVWVHQVVTPYFWTAPVREATASVEAAVKAALERVGRGLK